MAKSDDRTKRIREEILEAKKTAGIDPPRLIPRGKNFRSSLSGRPVGALMLEAGRPDLCRDVDNDVLPGFGNQDSVLGRTLERSIGGDVESLLARAERAVENLKGANAPRLAGTILDQLNLIAGVMPKNDRVFEIRARLEQIRFGGIEFKDVDDMPGGGQKCG